MRGLFNADILRRVPDAGKLAGKLMGAVYPRACCICGKTLEKGYAEYCGVCAKCEPAIEYVGENYCMCCGKELTGATEQYCFDCARTGHVYTQGAAVFVYTDAIKKSIYRFKYKDKREYAAWYAKMMAEHCGDRIRMWNPDVMVPVPLYRDKLRRRGYNQAELIAKELGEIVNIRVDSGYLIRNRETAPMKSLKGEERAKNLKKAFNIRANGVKYNKVLLVDDIYTTGATIDACAEELKDFGVCMVYCISLCVGRGI